jgi:hypothetical protein
MYVLLLMTDMSFKTDRRVENIFLRFKIHKDDKF